MDSQITIVMFNITRTEKNGVVVDSSIGNFDNALDHYNKSIASSNYTHVSFYINIYNKKTLTLQSKVIVSEWTV